VIDPSPPASDVLLVKRMQGSVLAIILAGLAMATAGAPGAARTSPSVRLNALDTALLVRVNAVRRAHALNPLKLSPALSDAADQHTTEMAQSGYFAHASRNSTLFWQRIERSYPSSGSRSWSVGENLLWAVPDVDATVAIRSWMNSPEHRANLLEPAWREVGIAARHSDSAPGIYGDQPVTILTADFGVRR
jgi:uncharacterized protein YkwD